MFLPLDPAEEPVAEHVALTTRRSWGNVDDWTAAVLLAREVPLMPHWRDVRLAFIEHGTGKSRRGDWKLGRVQGVLLASIPKDVLVHETMAGEWKRELTGNGNASKEAVEARGRELGFEMPDDNAWDALGIAVAMRDKNARAAGIAVA